MSSLPHLTRRLEDAVSSIDASQTVDRLLSEPFALSPWVTWTLIGLVRHRARQRWVTEIVRTRLQGSPDELGACGAMAHPENVAQQGVVPGQSDWEYCFHGRGCCLTHRTTGESIDVDFYDEIGDYFDDWFYLEYLRSLKQPEFPERRLIELHPSFDAVVLALEELKQLGALEPLPDSKVFRLSPACERLCDVVERFLELFNQAETAFLATVAVGDWLEAEKRGDGQTDATMRIVRERARQCRQLRIHRLVQWFRDERQARLALLGLMDAQAPEAVGVIRSVLRGRACPAMVEVLNQLLKTPDPVWCEDVYQLLLRLDPRKEIPEPPAWRRAAEFLLRTNYRCAEVWKTLLKVDRREIADVAILALEYAPELACGFFQRALRSPIPMERTIAAATLAVLDEPWAVQELLQALHDSDDREFSSSIRAALVCSRDTGAHAAVLAWERSHPYAGSQGHFYTWEDIAEQNSDAWLQHQMSELHDRVLPLRGRVR